MNHKDFLADAELHAWRNLTDAVKRNDLYWVSFYVDLIKDIHMLTSIATAKEGEIQM